MLKEWFSNKAAYNVSDSWKNSLQSNKTIYAHEEFREVEREKVPGSRCSLYDRLDQKLVHFDRFSQKWVCFDCARPKQGARPCSTQVRYVSSISIAKNVIDRARRKAFNPTQSAILGLLIAHAKFGFN